jgi:TonB family protein
VLAPEDKDHALDGLKPSLACDIVELVVLTGDEAFLQTLREGVGASRRLWHVPSSEKVSDLLVAGGVGILVIDVQALKDTAHVFITEIKRQFPDLVVLAAGNRDAETALARLISDGAIYRFIHKPMSPGRARLFADAAVKKYDEQRKRARVIPVTPIMPPSNRGLLTGAACAALCILVGAFAALHHKVSEELPDKVSEEPPARQTTELAATATEAPLLSRAAQALAANRLTAPSGDNALELYQLALKRNPADADARAGLAEVHERLLARVESALLEERLDAAAAAIDAASKAGVDSGRVALLAAQLTKARQQQKEPPAAQRIVPVRRAADQAAAHAMQRISEGHLIDPEGDNARFYVQEALHADPRSGAALEAQRALALRLMTEARKAIAQRDFARATSLLEEAKGIAARKDLDALLDSLRTARHQADTENRNRLSQAAEERIREDRLIEPANDSARFYLAALRSLDPQNSQLPRLTQDLGARLVAKAEDALKLKQFDAARSWLEQATDLGYSSPSSAAAQSTLESAMAEQKPLENVASASQLALVKSVEPVYPRKAQQGKIEGWVEVEFMVAESGEVKDIAVREANPPGVFEQAATTALAKWRYKPLLRDGKPVAQRARIRIRFTLAR